MPPALTAARLIRRSLRWPLLRLLTPGTLGLAMVVGVMADALDIPGLARLVGQGGPVSSAGWTLVLLGGWALLHSRGLERLFFGAGPLHWLARQPISARVWSLGLLGPLASVCAPVALLGLLQQPGRPLAGAVLWWLIGVAVSLAAAARARHTLLRFAVWAWAVLLAGGAGLATVAPVTLWVALAAGGLGLGALGPAWQGLARTPPRAPWLPSLRPVGVVGVMVRRDLLFLARRRPVVLLAAVVVGPVLAGGAAAMLRGGAVPPMHEGRVAALCLLPAVVLVAVGLGAHAAREPRAWDPPGWPLSVRERAAGLVLSVALLLAPAAAGLGLVGSAGPVVAGWVGSVGVVGWVVARARRDRLDLGSVVGLCILSALHPVVGVALGGMGLALLIRCIRRARVVLRPDPRARR